MRLDAPSIGVHTSLIKLGLNPDHTIEVPPLGSDAAGWFTASPSPGQIGPSIILGHVDSISGPSVFFRLGALRPGDRVAVERADGITVVFRVDRVARYPKSRFPTALVYGNTSDPQLRLITCGGRFDRSRRSYVDNIVVYASQAAPIAPALRLPSTR
jgi:sortase (surface protein transpeptidase)